MNRELKKAKKKPPPEPVRRFGKDIKKVIPPEPTRIKKKSVQKKRE